jgi:hypothetical protein
MQTAGASKSNTVVGVGVLAQPIAGASGLLEDATALLEALV